MRYVPPAILLILALALSGCIATKQQHERLQHRVSRIEQKQDQLRQKMEKRLDQMQTELQETVSQLKTRIQNSTSPVRSTQADMWSEIRNLRKQTAKLKGRLQTQDRETQQTNSTERLNKLESELSELKDRLGTMSSRLGLESLSTANATSEAGEEQKSAEEIPADELYERGLASFQEREYEPAATLWSLYIKKKPKGDLVPNAHFWQGEAYYQMEEYGEAALKYRKVVEDYPDSNKHSSAMLKLGISFLRLDKTKPARIMLQRVEDNYPDSQEAERARKQLESM